MSYTIAEVRDALKQVIEFVPGWRVSAYVTDAITAPEIQISRPPFDPRFVFGQAKAEHTFRATAYVGRTAEVAGAKALDALAELTGSASLIAAVQDGTKWPLTVDYAVVTSAGEVAPVEIAGAQYLACPFEIEVVW